MRSDGKRMVTMMKSGGCPVPSGKGRFGGIARRALLLQSLKQTLVGNWREA
jgi:hypothetical protein